MSKYYNIDKFVSAYFPEAKLTASGREYLVLCPWHEGTKKKMYIHAEKGIYNCFNCEAKGTFFSLVKFMMAIKKDKDVGDAIRDFEVKEAVTFISPEENVRPVSGANHVIPWPENYIRLYGPNRINSMSSQQATQYLLDRGLTPDLITYYQLGYCPMGKYERRIIIPVLNNDNELVSFVARDYTGTLKAKVLTPAAVTGTSGVKDYVFNLQNARNTRELIIGEGVFDAIALGMSGVALFGKQATERQIQQILLAKPLRIVVCLDADAPKENEELALRLCTGHPNVYMASLPEGDPASIGPDRLKEVLESTVKFDRFPETI